MPARLVFGLLLLSVSPALAQNAGQNAGQGAPQSAAQSTPQDKGGPTLADLLKLPAYASAWRIMLAPETPPSWVSAYGKTLDGPPTPSIPVQLLGETYTLGFTCKPNDCENNQLYVLFAPEGRDAWALLASPATGITWLGEPEAPIQEAITGALRK